MNLLVNNFRKLYKHLFENDGAIESYNFNFRRNDFTTLYINTFSNRYDELLL